MQTVIWPKTPKVDMWVISANMCLSARLSLIVYRSPSITSYTQHAQIIDHTYVRLCPSSTTFKPSPSDSRADIIVKTLHLALFLQWSFRCQARCRIVQWPRGATECSGEFIFRFSLLFLTLLLYPHIRLYFAPVRPKLPLSLDRASGAQQNAVVSL